MTGPIIITGGTSGISRATAVHLADLGHDVGLTYGRDPEGCEETAHAIAYVLSPRASYTTGTTHFVDGGLLMAAVGNQRTIMAALGGEG